MAPKKKIRVQTLSVAKPDWSLLPPELLNLISECLGDSFDASIHARSVCNSWRSAFSYPSSVLSRTTYSLPSFDNIPRYLPSFDNFPRRTLQNFPVFLFVTRATDLWHSKCFIGGIAREDHVDLPSPSPVQCTVKVMLPWSDPTSFNMRDYHIIPLGRQYAMVGYDYDSSYQRVAFLPLTKKGGGEFVVLLCYSRDLLVLTSDEMIWKWLEHGSMASCSDIVTFRGKFYALLVSGKLLVIDPYSLELNRLLPPPSDFIDYDRCYHLVPSGDDELYLVEKFIRRKIRVLRMGRFVCRVSRLDEETGKWVVVTDLGDRVLLIGPPGNRTCLGKELPDGCGVSGNSILFTAELGVITNPFKYGVDTRHAEDYLDLNFWRSTRQNRVSFPTANPRFFQYH